MNKAPSSSELLTSVLFVYKAQAHQQREDGALLAAALEVAALVGREAHEHVQHVHLRG